MKYGQGPPPSGGWKKLMPGDGSDPDYSPAYQDEYQRLWHEAAARAEAAERERDEARQACEKAIRERRSLEQKEDDWHSAYERAKNAQEAAEALAKRRASAIRDLLDYIGVDLGDDVDRLQSFGAPSCVLSARALLADGGQENPAS